METSKRRYSKKEIAERGEAIFDERVQPEVVNRDPGEFVVIDVETAAYEIDANNLTACRRLWKRVPGAQIWVRRVGSRFLCHFGGHGLARKS